MGLGGGRSMVCTIQKVAKSRVTTISSLNRVMTWKTAARLRPLDSGTDTADTVANVELQQ